MSLNLPTLHTQVRHLRYTNSTPFPKLVTYVGIYHVSEFNFNKKCECSQLSSTFYFINKNTAINKKLSPLLAISFDQLSFFLKLTRWWTLCSWIVFLSYKITSKQITSMQLTMFFIQPVTWYPCRSSLSKEFTMFSKKVWKIQWKKPVVESLIW